MHGAYIFLIVWIIIISVNAIFHLYYKEKILAWLIFQANSNPWYGFYPLKTEILKTYGKRIGLEYQHFYAKECDRCAGTGDFSYTEKCWCCGGTGIYKPEVWIGLARYKFGEYEFYIPLGRVEGEIGYPITLPIIQGKIWHKKQKYANEANLILSYFYNLNAQPKFKFGHYQEFGDDLSGYCKLNNLLFAYRFPYNADDTKIGKLRIWVEDALVYLKLKEELPF